MIASGQLSSDHGVPVSATPFVGLAVCACRKRYTHRCRPLQRLLFQKLSAVKEVAERRTRSDGLLSEPRSEVRDWQNR
jgi:hypothetical protein